MRVHRAAVARNQFNFVDVFGKGARGRIQQGTAADRMTVNVYVFGSFSSGTTDLIATFASSSIPLPHVIRSTSGAG
jgi:hypothetical protein